MPQSCAVFRSHFASRNAASTRNGALPVPEPAKTEVDLLDVLLVGVAMAVAFVVLGTLAATIFILTHRSPGLNPKVLEDAMTKNAFFIVPTQFVIYIAIIGFMALLVWVPPQNFAGPGCPLERAGSPTHSGDCAR